MTEALKFSHYGEERDLVCTEEEREIFDRIVSEFPDEDLKLVRVSDNYVTVKRGDWDIARIKFTNRAKWLTFPLTEFGTTKFYIDATYEVEDYLAAVSDSLEVATKYE